MKVLLLNGSPHAHGTTYAALSEAARVLKEEGIETEIYHLGTAAVHGCIDCRSCGKTGRCVFQDDPVNTIIEKAASCDGFIFGSPVHFAGPAGALHAVLDRAFYAGKRNFAYKPGAAVVCCRRGGATAAFDSLNKYFTIANMPVVPSQYWNMVHGANAADAQQDAEGLQTMRTLARNMAWMLRSFEAGRKAGISVPTAEPIARTNFIR
ncbi:MAG: flavodoxin family protein [Clostridiaceae bacterium]|nr:flavodoxin family protein [Clostridiaceae bacterium]